MANGGALVKHEGGLPIPSREEIIKDLIKYFATEYGWDLAESMFKPLDTTKLIEWWKKKNAGIPSTEWSGGKSGGGGVLLLLFAAFAFGGKKRRKR